MRMVLIGEVAWKVDLKVWTRFHLAKNNSDLQKKLRCLKNSGVIQHLAIRVIRMLEEFC